MDEELKRYLADMMKGINDGNERVLNRLTRIEGDLRDIRAEQKGIRAYIGARAGETETLMQHLEGE